jgi:hypothetical protein
MCSNDELKGSFQFVKVDFAKPFTPKLDLDQVHEDQFWNEDQSPSIKFIEAYSDHQESRAISVICPSTISNIIIPY